jgi:glycosyltransferase involved in cell wall biosynthesis
MRIAFVNHSRRKIGGTEVYLDSVIPAFARAGHDVACLYESDEVSHRELITFPEAAPRWCVAELSASRALKELRAWHPDVCFTHGLHDPDLEEAVVAFGHSVLYVHNFYGTCISGDKTLSNGTPTPCERRFGPACLLHYFPDHCGGNNAFTMWSLYKLQSRRLELMRNYRSLIANSDHMKRELARHELTSERVYPFTRRQSQSCCDAPDFNSDPLGLIFAGRTHVLKGGQFLIAALPEVQRRLGRNLHTTIAGDGPDCAAWRQLADSLRTDALTFDFRGWLSADGLNQAISRSHLMVMPSVWPEPFGLSGLEAGLLGVPTVAFAVGGIPEWLHNGVNGHLAALPAGSSNLVEAIARALRDPQHYAKLRAGAREQSLRYELEAHLAQLLQIFERCAA